MENFRMNDHTLDVSQGAYALPSPSWTKLVTRWRRHLPEKEGATERIPIFDWRAFSGW